MALKYWKEIVSVILSFIIFALYVRIIILDAEINKLSADLEVSNKQLEVSQISLKELKLTVDRQNESIALLEKEAKENLERHSAELTRSAATASRYKKQAQDLLNRKPQPTLSACDNANRLINEEIKNARN